MVRDPAVLSVPRPPDTDPTELMTAAKTSSDTRTDPSDPSGKGSILSPVQIAAGALAAVSAAVVASFSGVAGTLIGAALASVISTVSAALYGESLRRTNERLRLVRSRLTAQAGPPAEQPDTTRVLPAQLDPRRAPSTWRPRWPRIAAGAVAVFALAMGIVTGVELIGRQPVSALVGDSATSGTTTIGALTNVASHRDQTPPTPAPTTTPAAPSAESTPTEAPADSADESDAAGPSTTETPEPASTSSTSRPAEPTDASEGSSGEDPATDEEPATVP